MIQPVIKWMGSKRIQAPEIVKYIPNNIETYYEPFCGGCSIMFTLLESGKCKHFVCSDIDNNLISSYKIIKSNPQAVCEHYTELWKQLNIDSDIDRKREYFENIRARLNKEHNPLDFIFIMRVTTNGLPRYNKNGDFNNSFHLTRNGMKPERFADVVNYWSYMLKKYDVEFRCCSYTQINPELNDYVYCDPPYEHSNGMYFSVIDLKEFFEWCNRLNCKIGLSLDGIRGNSNLTVKYDNIDKTFINHIYISAGHSSFERLVSCQIENIYDSFYTNYAIEKTDTKKLF